MISYCTKNTIQNIDVYDMYFEWITSGFLSQLKNPSFLYGFFFPQPSLFFHPTTNSITSRPILAGTPNEIFC